MTVCVFIVCVCQDMEGVDDEKDEIHRGVTATLLHILNGRTNIITSVAFTLLSVNSFGFGKN